MIHLFAKIVILDQSQSSDETIAHRLFKLRSYPPEIYDRLIGFLSRRFNIDVLVSREAQFSRVEPDTGRQKRGGRFNLCGSLAPMQQFVSQFSICLRGSFQNQSTAFDPLSRFRLIERFVTEVDR